MAWKVKFSRKAEKQLDKLEANYQLAVFQILTDLQNDPKSLAQSKNAMKKLVNQPGFRLRTGDVRIKVKFDGDSIEVFFVGLKNDKTYK